jgi:hypothetical protein
LSLAKECYSIKLDLLTNATVVDDAINFVEKNSKRRNDDDITQQNENDEEEITNKIF